MAKQILKIHPRRFLLIFLLVLVVAVLALFLLARENLYGMLRTLGSANYLLVLFALGVYVTGTMVWAIRWHVTLSTVGHTVSIRDLVLTVYGGLFINNVTPLTYAGGDPIARSYLLNKTQKIPFSSGFATIFTEYVLDLPVYFSLVTFGLLMSVRVTPIWAVLMSLLILAILVAAFASMFSYVTRNRLAAKRVGGFITRVVRRVRGRANPRRIAGGISRFHVDAQAIVSRRTIVLCVIALSAALWALAVLRLFIIFHALGYAPLISMIALAATVPWIVGMVPLLPGGLGTVDAALVSIFLVFGVPPELALGAALIERAISFAFSTIAGAGALSYLTFKVLAR